MRNDENDFSQNMIARQEEIDGVFKELSATHIDRQSW